MKKTIIDILKKYANESEMFAGFITSDDFGQIADEIITVLKKQKRAGKKLFKRSIMHKLSYEIRQQCTLQRVTVAKRTFKTDSKTS